MADNSLSLLIKLKPSRHVNNSAVSDEMEEPEQLLHRCQRGEEDAWRELFEARAAQIYRWAVFLGLSTSDAEDAAQDVLATAVRRIHCCRAEQALCSWLFQITRRVVANHRRRARWRRWLFDQETMELPPEQISEHQWELELALRQGLAALPQQQAEVILLMDMEGMTRQETAEVLDLPLGTVASRHRLAYAALRTLMGEHPNKQGILSKIITSEELE